MNLVLFYRMMTERQSSGRSCPARPPFYSFFDYLRFLLATYHFEEGNRKAFMPLPLSVRRRTTSH